MGLQVEQPVWFSRAVWAHRLLLALGLVTTVLTVPLQNSLIRAWAMGRPDERRILETQGLQAVKDGAVRYPAFVPVALVLFVVLALLIWVLLAFFRGGYGWARVSLTGLVFFLGVATVAGIRTDPPTVFVVLSALSFPLEVVAIVSMWHPQTSQYVRGTWIVAHDETLSSTPETQT